jgi:hypothetical protein
MSTLDEIKPKKHQRVIDLVRDAGLDVTDWSNYKNGKKNPGANPKYCYEWAFEDPGRQTVLNLWHDEFREVDGDIEQSLNFTKAALGETTVVRINRRETMRNAVAHAYHGKLPVRVIVLDGRHRQNPEKGKPNRAIKRLLDPIPWKVASFDDITGEALFLRGNTAKTPIQYVDQFSLPPELEGATGKREVHGTAYNRSSAVRQNVLSRAEGKCEYCDQPGFILPGGSIYLETHHVKPLSEGGTDNTSNVVALCPNHHKEAHFGETKHEIREVLLGKFKSKNDQEM